MEIPPKVLVRGTTMAKNYRDSVSALSQSFVERCFSHALRRRAAQRA
jgi:hypothetical protein